jgi:hypothetical protein
MIIIKISTNKIKIGLLGKPDYPRFLQPMGILRTAVGRLKPSIQKVSVSA